MSYEIMKSVTLKGNEVWTNMACSNLSPQRFKSVKDEYFTKMLNEEGLEAVFLKIAHYVNDGEIKMQASGTKIPKLFLKANEEIGPLKTFILNSDCEEYMAKKVLNDLGKIKFDNHAEFSKLNKKRNDIEYIKSVVLEDAEKFRFLKKELTEDYDFCKWYVDNCKANLFFRMPSHFKNNKELALLALEGNGCNLRSLGADLCNDKDVVRAAFRYDEKRKYNEHLPDIMSEELQADKDFIIEIMNICPVVHEHRLLPAILGDKDVAITYLKTNKWAHIDRLPEHLRSDLNIQHTYADALKKKEEANSCD